MSDNYWPIQPPISLGSRFPGLWLARGRTQSEGFRCRRQRAGTLPRKRMAVKADNAIRIPTRRAIEGCRRALPRSSTPRDAIWKSPQSPRHWSWSRRIYCQLPFLPAPHQAQGRYRSFSCALTFCGWGRQLGSRMSKLDQCAADNAVANVFDVALFKAEMA